MQKEQKLSDDLEHFLHTFEHGEEEQPEQQETIHVYFVREEAKPEDTKQVIDSKPPRDPLQNIPLGVIIALALNVLLFFSILVSLLPQITASATITLIPVEKHLATTARIGAIVGKPTNDEIQARLLPSLTLTQSQTVPATGKGHQEAQQAAGTITFFNGLFTSQTVAAGTTFTGQDGVHIVTDQLAIIPAALATTPPTYGQVTVSAHALTPGPSGNILVRDVNQACCLPSVLAQNTVSFQGGQTQRNFTFVTRADIQKVVATLTNTLTEDIHAAFQAHVTPQEGLITPACAQTVTSDHQPEEEAPAVTVTVSERCTSVAYNNAALQEQATHVLTNQAEKQLGASYRLIGTIQVTPLHATITTEPARRASIAARVMGTWGYVFPKAQLNGMRAHLVGMAKEKAVAWLTKQRGVHQATLRVHRLDTSTLLPTNPTSIHIDLLYTA